MDRLKNLRKQKKITQQELAAILNVSQATLSGWESGKYEIDNQHLIQCSKFFGVSTDFLLNLNSETSSIVPVDSVVTFPIIGRVQAGYDGIINEEETGDNVNMPLSFLCGRQKQDFFVLQIKGNSMYPVLLDGDKILCQKCDSVDSGTLAIVAYGTDEATVKKVNYIQGQNWLDLIPANPEYQTKRIEGVDLEKCRIIGKVEQLIRKF